MACPRPFAVRSWRGLISWRSTGRRWITNSQIEGKLREVRVRLGKTRYRVLYFFDEARVGILLHGFTKNTAAVEETDKKTGRARMARHAAQGRTP